MSISGAGCRFCEPSSWSGAAVLVLVWAGVHPEAQSVLQGIAAVCGGVAIYLREGGE